MKIFLILLLIIFSNAVSAQVNLQQKARILVRFLDKNHYQPLQWNDSNANTLYQHWLEILDEEKLFFTQKDIASFQMLQATLDDEMNGVGWKFYTASVAMYQKALQRADSITTNLLSKPFDFSMPDQINWPAADFAVNEQDLVQRWMRFFKWQLLRPLADKFIGKGTTFDKISTEDFNAAEKSIRKKLLDKEIKYIQRLLGKSASFDIKMEDAFLSAIAYCYDPHTSYMNLSAKNEFETEMSAAAYSVGLDINMDEKGDKTIAFLQPGGSAWRSAQLHVGDVLVKIKTADNEMLVADISLDEVKASLSGNSELELELTIQTAAGEIKTLKLAKEKITNEESVVKSFVLIGKKNIGYINLPGFYSRNNDNLSSDDQLSMDGCANDVSKEIVKMKNDSIAGLILDLRYNGGGNMWEAMQLAGIFIDIGPVGSVKDKDGKSFFLKDPNRGTIYDGPLLLLVNGFSASASEFLSAVLQDYNRAIIAGSNTYGKGTAQNLQPMDTLEPNEGTVYKDFVKVTMNKFYRVNGSTIQWKGVTPDIFFPDIYSSNLFKEKAKKTALLPDLNKQGLFKPLIPIPFVTLKANSGSRVNSHPYFKTVLEFSTVIEKMKIGTIIPLQWEMYQQHYLYYIRLLKRMENLSKTATAVVARNNAFDAERIQQSNTRQQQNNQVVLLQLQSDAVIEEAVKIVREWTGND